MKNFVHYLPFFRQKFSKTRHSHRNRKAFVYSSFIMDNIVVGTMKTPIKCNNCSLLSCKSIIIKVKEAFKVFILSRLCSKKAFRELSKAIGKVKSSSREEESSFPMVESAFLREESAMRIEESAFLVEVSTFRREESAFREEESSFWMEERDSRKEEGAFLYFFRLVRNDEGDWPYWSLKHFVK